MGSGLVYRDGDHGVAQSSSEAVKWFRLAADQGLVRSQTSLGNMYRTGQGIPQNFPLALHFLGKAARKASLLAVYYISAMYFEGQGVPQNPTKALGYLEVAAAAGLADAQSDLSTHYALGNGVPQSWDKAIHFAYRTAKKGDVDGLHNLAVSIYEKYEGKMQIPTVVTLERMAAEKGNKNAQIALSEVEANLRALCHGCEREASAKVKLTRCSSCKVMYYCSRECQMRDWRGAHKVECGDAVKWAQEAATWRIS